MDSMEKQLKCEANYTQLTPLTFLKRAAAVYADRTSIIYNSTTFTWHQTYHRCRRLASSLLALNVTNNHVVSVLAPNSPALYEMHFAVPMAGAVLNAINIRLSPNIIATILKHSEAKLFFVDSQFMSVADQAISIMRASYPSSIIPRVVIIDDGYDHSPTAHVRVVGDSRVLEYEELVRNGDSELCFAATVSDEWDPIALNYTSGTTADPKGVVCSHRGAYLSTISLLLGWNMGSEPIFLWSLPMFHCNGWTFTWGVAARGGTNVIIRNATAKDIFAGISLHNITHMCCAPIVFNILLESTEHQITKIPSPVKILTGGAPPPPPLLEKMENLGFHIVHAYGLTEATGPALVCEWRSKWDHLPRETQSKLKARQGISVLTLEDADVKNLVTMRSVPRDGVTMGEIVLRGSSLMRGYYKDAAATGRAFKGGWFATGDVGVVHKDGYIEIKDRSKDVIISGGENICSIELETVLYRHPAVLEAAAVAMPHPKWGESPCVFVSLKKDYLGSSVVMMEADILNYCRKILPGFMMPKKVLVMEELPKTETGKIMKFQLRGMAAAMKVSDDQREEMTGKMVQLPPAAARKNEEDDLVAEKQILALSRL